jgi:hypothetical protein
MKHIALSAGILIFGLATAVGQAPRTRMQQIDKPPQTAIQGAAPLQSTVEAPIQAGGVRYTSGGRRDPFLSPIAPKKKVENLDEELPRGQQPPGIGGMYMAQVKLLGVVAGEGAPTAIFQGTDKRAYFLLEKDKLFDGYVKKIEPDSVILIRETKLRSGKLITQEVTKRLRTP